MVAQYVPYEAAKISKRIYRTQLRDSCLATLDAQLFVVCKARISIVITIRASGNIVDLFYLFSLPFYQMDVQTV